MLDGRIDTQGTIKNLRAQGVLEDITHEAAVEVQKEEVIVAQETVLEEPSEGDSADGAAAIETKKPRKLIKDEHRETGGVKWSIYKKYLKASYVLICIYRRFSSTYCWRC